MNKMRKLSKIMIERFTRNKRLYNLGQYAEKMRKRKRINQKSKIRTKN
jgi:hypothetical protein